LDECLRQNFLDGVQKVRPQKELTRSAKPVKRRSSPLQSLLPQPTPSPHAASYGSSSVSSLYERNQGICSNNNGSGSAEVGSIQYANKDGHDASSPTTTEVDLNSLLSNDELAISSESSLVSPGNKHEPSLNQFNPISSTLFDFEPATADNDIRHINITTSFSHPIIFYHEPQSNDLDPCSWCDSSIFGLWGYSLREVEVLPHGGEQGYMEISGGHGQDGQEQTKMCRGCTRQRIRMMDCQHMVEPIKNLDKTTLDMDAIGESFRALEQGREEGEELIQRVVWCSICVAPARYNCCSKPLGGCGLKLCQMCADLLTKVKRRLSKDRVKGKLLDDLVALWGQDVWNRDGKGELRADVDFLLTTGELSGRIKLGLGLFQEDDVSGQACQEIDNGIEIGFSSPHQTDSQRITTFEKPRDDKQRTNTTPDISCSKEIRQSASHRAKRQKTCQPESHKAKKQKTTAYASSSHRSPLIKERFKHEEAAYQSVSLSSLELQSPGKSPKKKSRPNTPPNPIISKPGSIHMPLYIEDSPPTPLKSLTRRLPAQSTPSKPATCPENSWIILPPGFKKTAQSIWNMSTKFITPSGFKSLITSGDNNQNISTASQGDSSTNMNISLDKDLCSTIKSDNISENPVMHKIEPEESLISHPSWKWDGRIPSNATVIDISDDE
jgi:hypothetical protein